jgi:hypothetical protein
VVVYLSKTGPGTGGKSGAKTDTPPPTESSGEPGAGT